MLKKYIFISNLTITSQEDGTFCEKGRKKRFFYEKTALSGGCTSLRPKVKIFDRRHLRQTYTETKQLSGTKDRSKNRQLYSRENAAVMIIWIRSTHNC